eukprot:4975108-Prymnesium_polylepis.3
MRPSTPSGTEHGQEGAAHREHHGGGALHDFEHAVGPTIEFGMYARYVFSRAHDEPPARGIPSTDGSASIERDPQRPPSFLQVLLHAGQRRRAAQHGGSAHSDDLLRPRGGQDRGDHGPRAARFQIGHRTAHQGFQHGRLGHGGLDGVGWSHRRPLHCGRGVPGRGARE